MLELYETNFDIKYLEYALELNKHLLSHFWDSEKGGFYFTPDYNEELLVRQKEIHDGAIPSGNSVSMLNLFKLSRITGDQKLAEYAVKTGDVFSENIKQSPSSYTNFLSAFDFGVKSCEIVIAGNYDSEDTGKMLRALRKEFLPNKVVLFKDESRDKSKKTADISKIAKYTENQNMLDGKATVYVCKNFSCSSPVTDISDLNKLLD